MSTEGPLSLRTISPPTYRGSVPPAPGCLPSPRAAQTFPFPPRGPTCCPPGRGRHGFARRCIVGLCPLRLPQASSVDPRHFSYSRWLRLVVPAATHACMYLPGALLVHTLGERPQLLLRRQDLCLGLLPHTALLDLPYFLRRSQHINLGANIHACLVLYVHVLAFDRAGQTISASAVPTPQGRVYVVVEVRRFLPPPSRPCLGSVRDSSLSIRLRPKRSALLLPSREKRSISETKRRTELFSAPPLPFQRGTGPSTVVSCCFAEYIPACHGLAARHRWPCGTGRPQNLRSPSGRGGLPRLSSCLLCSRDKGGEGAERAANRLSETRRRANAFSGQRPCVDASLHQRPPRRVLSRRPRRSLSDLLEFSFSLAARSAFACISSASSVAACRSKKNNKLNHACTSRATPDRLPRMKIHQSWSYTHSRQKTKPSSQTFTEPTRVAGWLISVFVGM